MDHHSKTPLLLAKDKLEKHLNYELTESEYQEIAMALYELALILIESN
jgi:hypothetical protein